MAHRRRHDGGLGDRRIEQPLVWQDVGKTAIDAEGAAPFAALLAIGDQPIVMKHVVQYGFEQRIAHGDGAHGGQFLAIGANA